MSLYYSDELRVLRNRVDALERFLESRVDDEGGGGGSEALGLFKHTTSNTSMKLARLESPVVAGGAVIVTPLSTVVTVNFLNMPPSPTIPTGSTLVGIRINGLIVGLWYGR